MTEIFHEAFAGYNLPLTILVAMIGLYWVISLFGFIDFESIDHALGLDDIGGHDADIDVDAGAGADVHGDVDGPGEVDGGGADGGEHDHHDHSPTFIQSTLRFLGANDAPIMFVMTLFALYTWGGNMLANYYLNDAGTTSRANILLIGVLIGAFVLTRITVRPLRPVMKMMRSASSPGSKPITGSQGIVRSKQLSDEYGQIEVIADGASLLLNARLSEGCDPVPRGSEVLIVAKDDKRKLYVARPLDTLSNPQSPTQSPTQSPNETTTNE